MDHLKKAAALILAAVGIVSCGASAFAADYSYEKGDYNLDGYIDSYDALLTLQASIYPEYLTEEKKTIVDINEDGYVDSGDALAILLKSIGVDYSSGNAIKTTNTANTVKTIKKVEEPAKTSTQVSDMAGWSSAEVVKKVGPLFTEDQRKTGILASVSMAQFIVESGYGQSDIAKKANNCFGIKGYPDGTVRTDSPWDGVSVYAVSTLEYDYYGNPYYENAYFRKYACMEDSIADHSRVLLTSTDGSRLRYADVVGVTDYRKAAQIIYNGGYCTAPDYVDLLCDVIEYWDLTQYDLQKDSHYASGSADYDDETEFTAIEEEVENASVLIEENTYKVRTERDNEYPELGSFDSIDNAVTCADQYEGYNVYDNNGKLIDILDD